MWAALNDSLAKNEVWKGGNGNFTMEKLADINQVIKVKVEPFIKGYFSNIKQSMIMTKGYLYITVTPFLLRPDLAKHLDEINEYSCFPLQEFSPP